MLNEKKLLLHVLRLFYMRINVLIQEKGYVTREKVYIILEKIMLHKEKGYVRGQKANAELFCYKEKKILLHQEKVLLQENMLCYS